MQAQAPVLCAPSSLPTICHWQPSEASMAWQQWKGTQWSSAKSKKTKGTAAWSKPDPNWCLASDPEATQSRMATYLSGFPPSHWRARNGELRVNINGLPTSYKRFGQDNKKEGIMILDINEHSVQFNVVMHRQDPMADIDAILLALKGHILLLKGSNGEDYIIQTTKDTNPDVKPGDHASQKDIIFRTPKGRTYKLGFTKNGDLVICMGFHRLRICVRNV